MDWDTVERRLSSCFEDVVAQVNERYPGLVPGFLFIDRWVL